MMTVENGLTWRTTLSACYYAPALDLNVISVGQLLSKGATGHRTQSGVMEVWDDEWVMSRTNRRERMYVVDGSIQPCSEP